MKIKYLLLIVLILNIVTKKTFGQSENTSKIEKDSLKTNNIIYSTLDTTIVNSFGNLIIKSKYQREVTDILNLAYENLLVQNKTLLKSNISIKLELEDLKKKSLTNDVVLGLKLLNRNRFIKISIPITIVSLTLNYFLIKR